MVRAGLVTAEQLHEALLEQQHTGLPLGRILIARGYASSAAVANALADQHGGVLRTEYGVAVGTLPETEGAPRWGGPPHVTEPVVTPAPSVLRVEVPPEAAPAVAPLVPSDAGGRHRVHVAAPEHRMPFADYCRRLGAEVDELSDGSFEVWFAADVEDELGQYLATWSATNGVELELRPADDEVAQAEPEVPPAEAQAEPSQSEPPPAEAAPAAEVPPLRVAQPQEQPIAPAPEPVAVPQVPQAPAPTHRGMRLGDLLVSKGFISEHQLAMALLESQSTGTLLGRVLLEKQWLFEDELARCLSEQWNLRFVSLGQLGVDRSAVRLVPMKVGLQFGAIPVRFTLDTLDVAFVDPTDEGALEAIDFFVRPFNPVVATLSDVTRMWRQVAA